jgi:TetR/AcrR family fatty acid metabolism transcriptional regulator
LKTIRKERDKLLRRNDILEAAERVFARKGFHKATMNDIAKESQYAVGTIYIYFKDKENLYFSLMESKMKDMKYKIRKFVEESKDSDKLKVLIKCYLETFKKNRDFFKIFFSEFRFKEHSENEKFNKAHIKGFMKSIEYITQIMELYKKQGIIRKDVNSRKAAHLVSGMINSTVFYWVYSNDKKCDVNNQVDFICDMVFNGIGK